MTFEKSVIIPFDLYQRCRLDKADRSLEILTDETLPSDRKLKLYNQATLMKNTTPPTTTVDSSSSLVGDHILHNIPDKDKPNVRAILDIFKSNPSELSWTDNLELMLDEKTVPDSNLINVLLYFTKNLPVTRRGDVPNGAEELYEKLIGLDMPPSWVKVKPIASRRSRTREGEKSSDDVVTYDDTRVDNPPRKKRKKPVNFDSLASWTV